MALFPAIACRGASRRRALVPALLIAMACRQAPTGTPGPAADPCLLASDASPPDSIDVALFEALDPDRLGAPVTGAERIVARQLYQTLVRIDCRDVVRPALAERWSVDRDGAGWTVELRRDQVFADGAPVDAAAVIASWRRRAPDGWPAGPIVSVSAVGVSTLRIRFVDADPARVRALAQLDWAIFGPPDDQGRPMASGPFRMAPGGRPNAVTLVPIGARPPRLVRVTAWPGRDPRDLLDRGRPEAGGPDLLVTADPATLGYARQRPGFRVAPLGWDRTYVLVSSAGPAAAVPDSAELAALARDVVRSDARAASGPFWWSGDDRCAVTRAAKPGITGAVGFIDGDRAGRDLAERVVALAGSPSPPAWVWSGPLDHRSLALRPLRIEAVDSAMRGGSLARLVLPFPRAATPGCGGAQRPRDSGVVPLVDARSALVVRDGIALSLDGDGTFLFGGWPR